MRVVAEVLVFWNQKLVFFAVPKTGTTSIEMALRPAAAVAMTDPPLVKHTPVYRYQRFLKPYFEVCGGEGFETVAIMREPQDWLGSWYRYRSREELRGQPNSTAGISFDDFVRGYLKGKRPPFAQVGSQSKFLQGADGGIGVDHLFRYDDHAGVRDWLAARLGRPVPEKRLNESPRMALELSGRMRERLREELPLDYAMYEAIGPGGRHDMAPRPAGGERPG